MSFTSYGACSYGKPVISASASPRLSDLRPTHMRVEDFNQPTARMTDACAGHALANIPIAAPEGSWSAVQRIPEHGASLDGPFGEDYEAATDGT